MPRPVNHSTVYIGIDPGKSGGLVAIYPDRIVYTPMPETERDVWEWFEQEVILARAASREETLCQAAIEWIQPSIFGVNKATMSVLYGSYMQLRGYLIASGVPFDEVKARDWQKALGVFQRKKGESKTRWKDRLRAKAQQLFPSLPIWSEPKSKGKQLAICDALLIAEFCKRKHEGTLG